MSPKNKFQYDKLVRLSSKKRPAKRLVLLITVLACFFVLVSGVAFVVSSHDDELRDAEVANTNVARMIAVQVESTLKMVSVALIDVAERVENDGTQSDALKRLQAHLVQITRANAELHGIFVYDADGAWIATSLHKPVQGNNSDREYFTYHRENPSREIHVGPPIRSRSTGVWIIPVSHRIDNADGSFGGVALVTLRVNFFERIYDELNVGKTGTVVLALNNGTLVYRRPFEDRLVGTNIAVGPVMEAVFRKGKGASVIVSKIDHIERLFSYQRLNSFPMTIGVGRTKSELLENWKSTTAFIAGAGLLICIVFSVLARKLVIQVVIRDKLDDTLRAHSEHLELHNSGLHILARTDKLTKIANRMMFDEVLERELRRAQRSKSYLSLVLLDIDFFKKFNDRYGHPAGDAVLSQIGRVLAEQVVRSGDLAARYGGEEFAVILPSTDRAGAVAVAERIRRTIQGLNIVHADSQDNVVTGSFGVCTVDLRVDPETTSSNIVDSADRQLYEAKRSGRNRVQTN